MPFETTQYYAERIAQMLEPVSLHNQLISTDDTSQCAVNELSLMIFLTIVQASVRAQNDCRANGIHPDRCVVERTTAAFASAVQTRGLGQWGLLIISELSKRLLVCADMEEQFPYEQTWSG